MYILFLVVTIPDDIEKLIDDNDIRNNPTYAAETIQSAKPTIITTHEESDREIDGSLLSPWEAIRRAINYYHNRSLQADQHGKSIYTPLQRAFDRKSSNKLARIAGICSAISFAIKICYDSIRLINFGDGLFIKEKIDNQQLFRLTRFHDYVKKIIKQKIDQAPKYGIDNRPLILVDKAAVKAAEVLFEYTSKTIDLLFDDSKIIKNDNDNSSTNTFKNLSTNISSKLSTTVANNLSTKLV